MRLKSNQRKKADEKMKMKIIVRQLRFFIHYRVDFHGDYMLQCEKPMRMVCSV